LRVSSDLARLDPDSRSVEVYAIGEGGDGLAGRIVGNTRVSAEPFPDLALAPAALWV